MLMVTDGVRLCPTAVPLELAIAEELPEVTGPIVFKKRKLAGKKKAKFRKKSRSSDD